MKNFKKSGKSGYTAENNINDFDVNFIEKVTKIIPFNHLLLTDFGH